MNITADDLKSESSAGFTASRGSDVASNLAKKTDGIIASAITEALGHNSWQLWAIAHRLRRVRINDQPQETWLLDDKPLLEIWPPEMETKREGDSIKAVLTVKYRTFGKHQNAALSHADET